MEAAAESRFTEATEISVLPMTTSLACKAILFDLDGVLVDSTECVERTWRSWAARHGLDGEALVECAHGRRTLETIRLVAPHLAAEIEIQDLVAIESTETKGIYSIEGARELLASLPEGTWAVVTSGVRAVAELRLRHVGLPLPDVMVCADEVSRGKPDPEGYLVAASHLGVPPDECVVIEDAPPGVKAAHAGGMRAVAVATTYPAARLRSADLVVEALTAIRIKRRNGRLHLTTS